MNALQNHFINAVLADAAYAKDLEDGDKQAVLTGRLDPSLTPSLAKYVSDNFEVVSHIETDDSIFGGGSGFDGTVWLGVSGGEYAGQIFVSMRGTLGAQDFLADADLASPQSVARRQVVDMVNWWSKITTPKGSKAPQIELVQIENPEQVPFYRYQVASEIDGTGQVDKSLDVQVNGHSLGGHLAAAFARLMGDRTGTGGVAIRAVNTFNSAGFSPGSEVAFRELEAALGIGQTTFNTAKQANIFAANGINVTTNSFWFNQVGKRIPVFVNRVGHHLTYSIEKP